MFVLRFPFKCLKSKKQTKRGKLKTMSAGILSQDFQFGTETAWHGLTQIKTAEEMSNGFPFDFKRISLEFEVDGKRHQAGGNYLIVSTDNNLPVGVDEDNGQFSGAEARRPSFGYMSNAEFFELVRNTIGNTGFEIASTGTLNNRQKRFVSLKPGKFTAFTAGGREFKNHLNLMDAVDGTMNLLARYNNTCVVCANTFAVAIKEGDKVACNPHTKRHLERIPEFEATIEAFFGYAKQFEKLLNVMDELPIDSNEAKHLFAGFLNNGKKEEISSRRWGQVETLVQLFETGKGNNGKTALDAFSAVTDFYTHEHAVNGRLGLMGQETQSEIGSGFKAKNRFVEMVSLSGRTPQGVDYLSVNKRNVQTLIEIGKASFDVSEAPKGTAQKKQTKVAVLATASASNLPGTAYAPDNCDDES